MVNLCRSERKVDTNISGDKHDRRSSPRPTSIVLVPVQTDFHL